MNIKMKAGAVVCLASLSAASFAIDWAEVGDAPDGVPANQMTLGAGALTGITGSIDRGAGDHVDTYCFHIDSQTSFFATTKTFWGGSAVTATGGNADTRLWLWSTSGSMMLGNDDVNTATRGTDTLASFISDPTTFTAFTDGEIVNATATPIVLTPGDYLLSISEFSNDPDGAGGVDQVLLGSDFDALHGPNLASGAFVAWENLADTTAFTYRIDMEGSSFCAVPEPGTFIAIGAGLALLLARRRK